MDLPFEPREGGINVVDFTWLRDSIGLIKPHRHAYKLKVMHVTLPFIFDKKLTALVPVSISKLTKESFNYLTTLFIVRDINSTVHIGVQQRIPLLPKEGVHLDYSKPFHYRIGKKEKVTTITHHISDLEEENVLAGIDALKKEVMQFYMFYV